MKIYIASKTSHGAKWRALREAGWSIAASWIDESEPGATSDWADLWRRCIAEVSAASALIVYVEPGEHHKGSLIELGVALAHGVPVYWVGPEIGSIRKSERVTVCVTVADALTRISGWVRKWPADDGFYWTARPAGPEPWCLDVARLSHASGAPIAHFGGFYIKQGGGDVLERGLVWGPRIELPSPPLGDVA